MAARRMAHGATRSRRETGKQKKEILYRKLFDLLLYNEIGRTRARAASLREMLMRSRTQNTSCASASGGPRPSGGPTGYRRRLPVLAADPATCSTPRRASAAKDRGTFFPFFLACAALHAAYTLESHALRAPSRRVRWVDFGVMGRGVMRAAIPLRMQ